MIDFIDTAVTRNRLREIASVQFGEFVKAVVDDSSSAQNHLWGSTFTPTSKRPVDRVRLDDQRPSEGNRSRDVQSPEVRSRIVAIVKTRSGLISLW